MLTLWTGKPGNGKTLNLLFELEAERKAQAKAHAADATKPAPRPIYYHGIPELTLEGWFYWEDPTKWKELPTGAILVVDEAQKHFPVREKGKAPDFVTDLSTHRHLGVDLHLVTQDPMLVDVWLRRLVNRHIHVVRPWGVSMSFLYEWQQVTDIGDIGARKQALTRKRPFPKEFFGVYKSADMHTQQARPPWAKLVGIGVMIAAAIGLVLFVIFKIISWGDASEYDPMAQQLDQLAAQQLATGQQVQSLANSLERLTTALAPQIEGVPWSAPFYGDMVRPKVMPYVSGCARWQSRRFDRCTCTDQQGAVIPMEPEQCISWLESGDFDWSAQRQADNDRLIAELEARQGGGGSRMGASSRTDADSGAPSSIVPGVGASGS